MAAEFRKPYSRYRRIEKRGIPDIYFWLIAVPVGAFIAWIFLAWATGVK